jgi:predicted ATP-grasp superfamily ATP-dependent carboligase
MAGGEDLAGAGFSRYCGRSFTYPPSGAGLAATHAVVIDRVRRWRPDVVFPVFTHAWHVVYAFYEEYDRLTRIVPSPGRTLFDALNNKATLIDRAREHAVPMPVTYAPASHEEALALGPTLPYPVLLKPRKKWGGRGIRCVLDKANLRHALAGVSEVPIIQELIEGDDFILNILCSAGEPLAASAYQVLRRHPLPYGPPVACRTIHDEALVRMGTEFLRRLHYHGVANLDIRRDRRDGSLKLLEVNPRLSETIEISVRSGINIPYILYRMALGEVVTPVFGGREGLEFRWLLFGELLHLVQSTEKRRTISELFAGGRVATNVALTDPLPHLIEGVSVARRLLRRRH